MACLRRHVARTSRCNASEELWLFLPPCFYSGYATPAALCGAGARGDVTFEERNAESERRAHGRALGHDAQDRAAGIPRSRHASTNPFGARAGFPRDGFFARVR